MNHTHRRANRKTASDVINELWFDRDTGDVYEIWIDGNYVVGYNLTFEGGPFTVSEVAGESVYSPSDFRLQRDGVVSKDDITVWGLVPIDTLEKGQAIEIIERNGYPMPASLGHARDSHRANRKGSINETLLKELMDEIVERERETGGWGAGDFNSDIEEVLWRRMTSPHSTKRLQDDLGVPINEDWRYDAEGMTDLRFISVREFLHDQRWEDIFDAEYGSRYNASHRANRRRANDGRPNGWLDGRWVPSNMPFDERDKFWGTSPDGESRDGYVWLEYDKDSHRSSRRANRRVAGTTKQDLAGITVTTKDMGSGWEFYVARGEQGGFEWYLFNPSGELDTIRLTNSIDKALGIAEIIVEEKLKSLSVTDEERDQMMRDNEDYLRGLKGGSRRANRKSYKSKLDLYFSAFNRAGDMVEITAKPDGNGYIWSYQGPDYGDYDKMMITLPFEEAYNLFLREMGLTQGDFFGPEIYTHTANRRANRKRASERMNYGTVYVVTSDGDVVEGDTPGDMEFVSVHVYADDQPEVGYYDFGPIVDELYEGVVSSIGAEPVEVVPDYFIGDMGVSADELAKFGPGEYRLCPVSLSFWVGEGEFGDLEEDDGFNYDVVVRY